VTEFAWLASYPKSGNTWFRLLIANLAPGDKPADINALPERGGIASGRGDFHFHTLIDSGLLTHDEADVLRPRVYEAIAEHGDGESADFGHDESDQSRLPRLIKAHDAYLDTPLGEPLLAAARGARRAILIVRDPRDVAPSLANHRRSTIDAAIDFLVDRQACFAAGARNQNAQLRQRLLDWSGHAASWLEQGDLPVHLVRYEDLKAAPVETFTAALDFLGVSFSPGEVERAVDFASFERLQAQEKANGFTEWRTQDGKSLFFRRGESQGWRRELTPDQVRRIEAAHAPMMARLGYAIDAGVAPRQEASDVRAEGRLAGCDGG
jgi:aryl sulfotransferase